MPYTVLKTAKLKNDRIEVVGEFPTEASAKRFVEDARRDDSKQDFEFSVESPPSQKEHRPPPQPTFTYDRK